MFKRALVKSPSAAPARPTTAGQDRQKTGQRTGRQAEDQALAWLQAQGLKLVERNYRVARGPSARGGEIDLVMREPDGTLVFVEVRARRDGRHGGAAASVGAAKQRSLRLAAEHYLARLQVLPPCRFDVMALDGNELTWIRGAFSG